MLIIILAQFIWAPFKTISRSLSTNDQLRSSVPKLLTQYRKTPFTLEDGLCEWKGDGNLIFATKDQNLIGMMRLDRHRNYYELSSFVVDPAYQGCGYGGKLLNYAINSVDLPIWLKVHRDNPACTLYSRYGFVTRDLVNNRFVMRLR